MFITQAQATRLLYSQNTCIVEKVFQAAWHLSSFCLVSFTETRQIQAPIRPLKCAVLAVPIPVFTQSVKAKDHSASFDTISMPAPDNVWNSHSEGSRAIRSVC